MQVECNYCSWVGQYPSPAQFDTDEEYQAEVQRLNAEHDAQCPHAKAWRALLCKERRETK